MELQEKSIHIGHHPLRSASDGLPNLVGATYVAPAMRTSMHGIPPYSTIGKSSLHEQPYQIRPSAMRPDATIFLAIQNRPVSTFFVTYKSSTFSTFFDFSILRPQSLIPHILFNRPSLIACYAPSEPPMPLFTSDFHYRGRKHRCRQILTFGDEILAILEYRTYTCSTNNPLTWQCGLCRILLANGMQILECDRVAHGQ